MKKLVDIILGGCYSVRCIIENGKMPFWGFEFKLGVKDQWRKTEYDRFQPVKAFE